MPICTAGDQENGGCRVHDLPQIAFCAIEQMVTKKTKRKRERNCGVGCTSMLHPPNMNNTWPWSVEEVPEVDDLVPPYRTFKKFPLHHAASRFGDSDDAVIPLA